MNTDFNFDFTTSGDENDHLDYLLDALIRKYNRYSLHEWKVGLSRMKQAVVTDSYESRETNCNYFNEWVPAVKEIIEEAWLVLEKRRYTRFEHEYIGMRWENNPYAFKTDDIRESNLFRTSYLRAHQEKITVLSEEETRNFFLVLEDFFQQLDVVSWLRLMDKWLEFSLLPDSISASGYDSTPLETYHQVMKLIEACYLMEDFRFAPGFYPPNIHLFTIDNMMLELYSETYDGYNPYLLLSYVFERYSLSGLKNDFSYWMKCAKNKDEIYAKDEPEELLALHSNIVQLLEIGWLILYTQEMPKHWLNPETFSSDFDVNQVNIEEEVYTHLKGKERKNPGKALRKFYKKHNWYHYQRMTLEDALYLALQTKRAHYSDDILPRLEDEINKLMEILYALNRELYTNVEIKC